MRPERMTRRKARKRSRRLRAHTSAHPPPRPVSPPARTEEEAHALAWRRWRARAAFPVRISRSLPRSACALPRLMLGSGIDDRHAPVPAPEPAYAPRSPLRIRASRPQWSVAQRLEAPRRCRPARRGGAPSWRSQRAAPTHRGPHACATMQRCQPEPKMRRRSENPPAQATPGSSVAPRAGERRSLRWRWDARRAPRELIHTRRRQ